MKLREFECHYQPYIMQPPVPEKQLYQQACSNDDTTIEAWRDIWIKNAQANKKTYGSFKDKGLGNLFGCYRHRPVIIAGSGPSLKYTVGELKNKGDIPLVSCLHNFNFFEDNGIDVDYYVTLDSGNVTVEEVYEGGGEDPEHYWNLTKNRKLIAFISTDPELLEKWQGEIYFYNAPIPDKAYREEIEKIEVFNTLVSTGGNVFGACLYITKAIMGSGATIFIGADFSFENGKFHSWDSKYDKNMGYCVPIYDLFGNKKMTWQSYKNFKSWFDSISLRVPGIYINCSEGGALGSYAEGNLFSIRVMDLKDCFSMYNMSDQLKEQNIDPTVTGPDGQTILF